MAVLTSELFQQQNQYTNRAKNLIANLYELHVLSNFSNQRINRNHTTLFKYTRRMF